MSRRVILFTGGGTAGHITPNLALIPLMRRRGWVVHYIGSHDGMEKSLVGALGGVTYHGIATGKLRRYLSVRNFSDPVRVLAGTAQAVRILKAVKPAVIFSKGGFVSVPVAWAAKLCRIPLVLHESDLTPGLANRLALGAARRICTTFAQTAQTLGDKAVFTGTPIRPELFAGDAARARALCGFEGKKPVLLMMGGSQGASGINTALRGALPQLLPQFDIIHLCGRGNLDDTLARTPGYYQLEYATAELPDLLALAGMVLSRAGANSLFEFLALSKPMLLVPLPLAVSRGDQIENARNFERQGLAHVLQQEDLTPQTLTDAVRRTWQDRAQLRAVMVQSPARNATERIADILEQTAQEG